MHASPQETVLQQQAVAAFLPSLRAFPFLLDLLTEKLLGSASLAAVVTPECLRRHLQAPGKEGGPSAGSPTSASETAIDPSLPRERQTWAPLQDQEVLQRIAALQLACPSVCVLATLLPRISLFDQLAPRRRLLQPRTRGPFTQQGAPPSGHRGPFPQQCTPEASLRGSSRFVLIPLYRHHEDYEGEDAAEREATPSQTISAEPLTACSTAYTAAAAAAANARAAAIASAAAAGVSCISGSWRQIALEVGALRALEPNARIIVVFVGTRTALTTPQPLPLEPEGEEDSRDNGVTAEQPCCPSAAASATSKAAADPVAAAGRNSSSSSSKGRRMGKRKAGDLLPSLDALVCELLLLWQVDTAYEHSEETAAVFLLRLLKTAAATRQPLLLPRGKLRRLAATASDEAAAAACAAVAAAGTNAQSSKTTGAPTRPDPLRRLWKAQLLQLPGVSEDVASAVSEAFPSPFILFARAAAEAEEAAAAAATVGPPGAHGSSNKKKHSMCKVSGAPQLQAELAGILVAGRCGSRRVGEALAGRILRVFALETDPEAPL